MNKKQETPEKQSGTLGTFSGVFTPSILTILGIILFLRLGYVVGNAGLGRTLLILALANGISILTTFSLSAIATNLKVKGGGDYYVISRTLGVEFGGALGIVIYLAQSVSIAFYCIGFAEVVARMLPWNSTFLPQGIAACAVAFLFIFAWMGADWATRFQYVVMGILCAALISFFWGGISHWQNQTLAANWSAPVGGLPFWTIFAIFFPAVTGFTQGVSMSGDLKDAGKSLPLGTFLAVGVSIVVYFLATMVFSASLPADVLANDYTAMKRVAMFEVLITAGVIAATLSSAMASFLGAPRILQSLAADKIFPFLNPFEKGSGTLNNPRRAVLLSAAIAVATIGIGNLNIIAPIVSMFFLISYGLLNYATYYEARTSSPSFRPRFRFYNARISLAGALACLGVMLAIDIKAGIVALAVLSAIHQYLKRTAGPARWAASKRAYHLKRVREHLLEASKEPEHPRDWRPQILVLSRESARRRPLLQFANWCDGESGLTSAVQILEGEGLKMLKLRAEAEKELQNDITKMQSDAFPKAVVAHSMITGLQAMVQSYGIGPLHANTILFNWLDHYLPGRGQISKILHSHRLKSAFRLGCNLIVLSCDTHQWENLSRTPSQDRRIDVWWRNDASSRLMLLLAHIITREDAWQGSTIRLLAPTIDQTPDEALAQLREMLDDVRIDADPVIISPEGKDDIVRQSADAALVFLPFKLKKDQPIELFGSDAAELLSHLSVSAMVLAAEDIELDAEPEAGKAGDMASAMDALTDAEKRARKVEKEAQEALDEAKSAKENLKNLEKNTIAGSTDESELNGLKATAEDAEKIAEKAARRSAKAKAKLETAEKEVEALGIDVSESGKDPE